MKQLILLPVILFMINTFQSPTIHTATSHIVAKDDVCPVCKSSNNVIRIVYGKPTTETMKKAERGECKLGGCVLGENSPKFYCKKDKREF